MPSKSKGLGKGLGALFGEEGIQPDAPQEVTRLKLQEVEPNRGQPRKAFDEEALEELAESIRRHGILQPLAVRKLDSGFYQIIAGERRWRAARRAGLEEVPVIVVEADDIHAMELALIENLQREDLNPIEEALGFQTLMEDYGLTQEAVAAQVGRSRPAVANALRLLHLPESVKAMVEDGRLSGGHARALLQLGNGHQMEQTAEHVVLKELSVRETEALVRNLLHQREREEAVKQPEETGVNYLEEVERRLSGRLGRRVHIVPGRRKGRCEIEFYGNEDLEKLLEALERL